MYFARDLKRDLFREKVNILSSYDDEEASILDGKINEPIYFESGTNALFFISRNTIKNLTSFRNKKELEIDLQLNIK